MQEITQQKQKRKKKTAGTQEWADSNINIQYGCENGCYYCYAYTMAHRFSEVQPYRNGKTLAEWKQPELNKKAIHKRYGKRKGRIMTPTTHDITQWNWVTFRNVIYNIAAAGNELLITSKPRYEVIKYLCEELREFQEQIQFRFTITSPYNPDMAVWEPNAPNLDERLQALKHAYQENYKTSISIEPYLANPLELIKLIEPYTTESIWVGIMNTSNICSLAHQMYKNEKMGKIYSTEFILTHLESWKTAANGKLRLKDSVRNLLGVKKEDG